jgi:transaldolase
MKIFIDSGDTDEIREAQDMGLIDGVTLNPTLAAKSGKSFKELVLDVADMIDGPISAEIPSGSAREMIAAGEDIASWHRNIVIKVPLIAEGLRAVRHLSGKGIKTNVTLCFNGAQALLAAKAGATYVSPHVGRLDDAAPGGLEVIRDIRLIYDNYGYETQILTASARTAEHFLLAARIGSDVIAAPWSAVKSLLQNPLAPPEAAPAELAKAEAAPSPS